MGKLISKNDTEMTPARAHRRFMLEQSMAQACTYWLFSLNAFSFNHKKVKMVQCQQDDGTDVIKHNTFKMPRRDSLLPGFHLKCQSSSGFIGASNPALSGQHSNGPRPKSEGHLSSKSCLRRKHSSQGAGFGSGCCTRFSLQLQVDDVYTKHTASDWAYTPTHTHTHKPLSG